MAQSRTQAVITGKSGRRDRSKRFARSGVNEKFKPQAFMQKTEKQNSLRRKFCNEMLFLRFGGKDFKKSHFIKTCKLFISVLFAAFF
jgi:hypothetical protein